jgi:hypothetical protein
LAVETAVGAGQRRVIMDMLALRYLDVGFAVIAAVAAIALGAPVLGCALGGGGWALQRAVQVADRAWARRLREPHAQLGVSLFERFGRIWLLAGAIVLAGVVGGRSDGLAAALIIFGAYTIRFVIGLASGPPPTHPDATPPPANPRTPTTRSER